MTLCNAIIKLYPDLKAEDFFFRVILLQNDSDGKGDYIKEWNHPTHAQPTEEQLIAAGWVKQ
jgi:XkdW protein